MNIVKDVGLRSMKVKYKEENSSLCQNCSNVSLAQKIKNEHNIKTCTKISNFTFIKEG